MHKSGDLNLLLLLLLLPGVTDAIGKVRELRSHQNKAVAAKANEVFNHWKRKHKQQGQSSGAASAAGTPSSAA